MAAFYVYSHAQRWTPASTMQSAAIETYLMQTDSPDSATEMWEMYDFNPDVAARWGILPDVSNVYAFRSRHMAHIHNVDGFQHLWCNRKEYLEKFPPDGAVKLAPSDVNALASLATGVRPRYVACGAQRVPAKQPTTSHKPHNAPANVGPRGALHPWDPRGHRR